MRIHTSVTWIGKALKLSDFLTKNSPGFELKEVFGIRAHDAANAIGLATVPFQSNFTVVINYCNSVADPDKKLRIRRCPFNYFTKNSVLFFKHGWQYILANKIRFLLSSNGQQHSYEKLRYKIFSLDVLLFQTRLLSTTKKFWSAKLPSDHKGTCTCK